MEQSESKQMNCFSEALAKIQWVTNSPKFNEKQQIDLGNAIAAFDDCIKENDSLSESFYFCNIELIKRGKQIKILKEGFDKLLNPNITFKKAETVKKETFEKYTNIEKEYKKELSEKKEK